MGALWVDQKGGALWVFYGLTRRVAPIATTLAVLWFDGLTWGRAHRYHSGCSMV